MSNHSTSRLDSWEIVLITLSTLLRNNLRKKMLGKVSEGYVHKNMERRRKKKMKQVGSGSERGE